MRLISFPPMTFAIGVLVGKTAAVAGDYDWGDVALYSPFLFVISWLLWMLDRSEHGQS